MWYKLNAQLSCASDAKISREHNKNNSLKLKSGFHKLPLFYLKRICGFSICVTEKGQTSLEEIVLRIFFRTLKSPVECPVFQQPGFTVEANWFPQIPISPRGSTQHSRID